MALPEAEIPRISPQPGPQSDFLQNSAQIIIYGGSAGSGKSFALLLEPLRNVLDNPKFSAVLFRRTTVSIRRPGSIWDESIQIYGQIKDAKPTQHNLEWKFPKGGKIVFAHLEYNSTVLEWHASQIPLLCYDELCEFTEYQFFYMLSRNRSMCGVPPYIRATCNPDADSWVARLISWWIDDETGFPIQDRSGVVRWFLRVGDELIWAAHPDDLQPDVTGLPETDKEGNPIPYIPKSLTFIAADIYDNPILMRQNPEYLANLLALPTVERERLLKGNWKIRPAAGLYFKRDWIKVIKYSDIPPLIEIKRGWDLAGTAKTQLNDPDWTCGTKIGRSEDGNYYILDHTYLQRSPGDSEVHIKAIAAGDTRFTEQWFPQDPGQAGKWQATYFKGALAGFSVRTSLETGDKVIRFGPFSSMAQAGKVFVVEGGWNDRWFNVLEGFPEARIDDDVDSTSRAFNAFLDSTSGLIEYYKEEATKLLESKKDIPPPSSEEDGGIRVKPPNSSINILYDSKGRSIFLDKNGCFVVTAVHAEQLAKSGFIKQTAEVIDFSMKRAANDG